jgi:hypothetical protein
MNGDEVLVGLMRIVALGDAHTHLEFRRCPRSAYRANVGRVPCRPRSRNGVDSSKAN